MMRNGTWLALCALLIGLTAVPVRSFAATAPRDRARLAHGPVSSPSTSSGLLANLLYIVRHDLAFRPGFYSDKSLRHLLGATHIGGERTSASVSLTAQLLSTPTSADGDPGRVPVAHVLIRRNSDGQASIQVQLIDVAHRPPYAAIETILGDGWKPWSATAASPHLRIMQLGPNHENAHQVLQIRSPLADNGIEVIFDPDGRLHHFMVFIYPIAGRN